MKIVLERHDNGTATLTLNRPEVMNALDVEAKEKLADIWEHLDDDADIRAIVLRGAGPKAFCAGSDIKEVNATGEMVSTETLLRAIPNGMRVLKTPVIAALHGHCVGMGMTLAVHCDLRFAAPDAVISFPEVNHGMISAVSAMRLARFVGPTFASEMLLVGERHTAEACMRHGLLNGIVDDVHAHALDVAARIAAKPWPAVQAHKRLAAFATSRNFADERAEIEAVRGWLESHNDFRAGAERFTERPRS